MDPRRIRSRARLQAALKTLLADAGIDQIRVDELCRAAGVTRPTFYANFGSVQALLDDYLDQLLAELRARIEARAPDAGPQVPPEEMHRRSVELLAWVFEAVGTDDPRMRCLLLESPGARVEAAFAALFRQILDTRRAQAPDAGWRTEPVREAALHFFTGALVSLLRLRLAQPRPMPAPELAALAASLMTYGRAGKPDAQS